MDDVSRAVAELYESYPYPSQPPGSVADVHPGLMLSYLGGPRSPALRVLDAGCGTGLACLGTALCNPRCQVTGVDLNPVALERVRAEAVRLGLQNLELVELDLMDPASVDKLPGNYDLIVSSGVLHHLADPATALKTLVGWLHPRGLLRLMVYNRLGRAGLYRFVEALEVVAPRSLELPVRLEVARQLMANLAPGPANGAPWDDANQIPEVEFVDRYLHPRDQSYSVSEFLALTRSAGLEMVRWYEPRDWTAGSICQQPELLQHLSPEQLWSVVELLGQRKQLDAIFRRPGPGGAAGDRIALSPQTTWVTGKRLAGSTLVTFASTMVVRDGPEELLQPAARALLECLGADSLSSLELRARMGPLVDERSFEETLADLLEREILYRRCPIESAGPA